MTDMNNEQAGTDVPLNFDELAQTMNEFEISIARDTALAADLQSLKVSVEALGGIDRSIAATMELAAPGMLNTDRYPLASYTQSPSRTNYTHAMESADSTGRNIGQRIWDAIVNALKTIWRVFKRLLDTVLEAAEGSAINRVATLQKHIKEILAAMSSTDQHAAKERMKEIAADPVSVIGSGEYDRVNTKLGLDIGEQGRIITASSLLFGSFAGLLSELVETVNKIPSMSDEQCSKLLDKSSVLNTKGLVAVMYNAGIHSQSEHYDAAAATINEFKSQVHDAKDSLAGHDVSGKLYSEHSLVFNPLLKDARGLMSDARELNTTINKLNSHTQVLGTELPAKRDLIKRTFKEINAVMDISSIYYFIETYQRTALNAYVKILKAQIRAITPKGNDHE